MWIISLDMDRRSVPQAIDPLLSALGEHLEALGGHVEVVVIGGAALQVLGYVDRPTRDVDVVALLDGARLREAEPLPEVLREAAARVARDFGLPEDWLNAGPTEPVRHEADLRALRPTREELVAAARWARTHDPSEGFRRQLEAALRHLGVEDADLGP